MTGTTLGSDEDELSLAAEQPVPAEISGRQGVSGADRVIDLPLAPDPDLVGDSDARSEATQLDRLCGARVLMTTMYYRPETTGSAPYTADLAEHLAACGAQVQVVTMHPHYPQWRRPEGVANRLGRERLAGVDVVRVSGYVPRQPSLLKRAAYEAVYITRAWPHVRDYEPDVIIACTPSLFAGALGAAVAQRRGVPCVTVVQDLITSAAAQSGLGGAARAKALLSAVERWTFQHSARITVPSAAFVPAIRELAPDAAVSVVPNWSRLALSPTPPDAAAAAQEDLRQAMRRRLGWDGRFVVAHTGNMGLKQGLEDLDRALHHLAVTHPNVLVSFVGDGTRREVLEQVTAGLSSAEVRDPVSSQEYPLLLQAADALLVHERSTVRDMSLPSKLTSYFAAGRPVLAKVRRDSATAAEIERSGAGVVVDRDDPTALALALARFRDEPQERDRLGAAGVAYAYEALRPAAALGRLVLLINDVLSDGTETGKRNA
jgi:glycosyltransferase involved in cell wall biosynthesis